jgi:thioredoxin-like negative regulator of GroEL
LNQVKRACGAHVVCRATKAQLAAQFGIRAIPTLLLFKGGQVIEQVVGLKSKRDLKSSLDRAIA